MTATATKKSFIIEEHSLPTDIAYSWEGLRHSPYIVGYSRYDMEDCEEWIRVYTSHGKKPTAAKRDRAIRDWFEKSYYAEMDHLDLLLSIEPPKDTTPAEVRKGVKKALKKYYAKIALAARFYYKRSVKCERDLLEYELENRQAWHRETAEDALKALYHQREEEAGKCDNELAVYYDSLKEEEEEDAEAHQKAQRTKIKRERANREAYILAKMFTEKFDRSITE